MSKETLTTNVVVIGLGAMGANALWRIAARGIPTIGIERFTPGHDRGSSHGGSRIFRTAVFEGQTYVPMARTAHRLWRELETASGRQLLRTTSGLMFGPADGEVVQGSRAAAATFDLAHEVIDDTDKLRGLYPQISFRDGDVGVVDRDAGVLFPERAIRAASAAAETGGAQLLTGSGVTSFQADGDSVIVETDRHVVRGRTAIVSVGAWTSRLLPHLNLPLEVHRAVMTWYAGTPSEDYQPERLPVFVRDTPGNQGWGVPDVDGLGLKLGPHEMAGGRLEDPDDNPPGIVAEDTQAVQAFCRDTFPRVDSRPAHAQVCMTTHTPDGDFILGTPSTLPNVVLLAGFSGHGFKHASAVGEIAAQCAVEGGTTFDVSRMSPDRWLGSE